MISLDLYHLTGQRDKESAAREQRTEIEKTLKEGEREREGEIIIKYFTYRKNVHLSTGTVGAPGLVALGVGVFICNSHDFKNVMVQRELHVLKRRVAVKCTT